MSIKKIQQVKKDRGFRLPDLIIYGAVAALVVVLFIVIFTTRNSDPLTGVRIYVASEVVFEYSFDGTPEYADGVQVEEDAKGITVTIKSDGGDLNVVYIDKSARTVKMTEANCKGRQCLYFPEMNNNSSFIYCSPHLLRIEPLEKQIDSPDLIM